MFQPLRPTLARTCKPAPGLSVRSQTRSRSLDLSPFVGRLRHSSSRAPCLHQTRPTLRFQVLKTGNTRHASSIPFMPGKGYLRYSLRQHPILIPLGTFIALFGAVAFAYSVWEYMDMLRKLANYPENVGLKLRRAIYFTDVSPDYPQALKAYSQAIQLAAQEGMDPLSDEVIGIKSELARCLDKAGSPTTAIEVLEAIKRDCIAWMKENGADPANAGKRTKVLRWACILSGRMGELYSSPFVADPAQGEESLVWAVETMLRESQRREREGLKEGEGDWLTKDEMGSQLETLGHMYEERDNHYFASQLFLQALMIKPTKDCHSVILMNNLAASIAQQNPPTEPGATPPTTEQLRESGRTWLRQAMALAETIEPPLRNDECDRGCAVAIHNLGEFAEMDGNLREARERYEEAASIAHAIRFEEGVISAHEGIRRLDNPMRKGGGKKQSGSWWS